MRSAAEELKYELSSYPGIFDVADTFRSGKQEIQLNLLPEARNLGLTLNDLASQVRNAFYGVEAQRIQRGRDDIKVMVRYPLDERQSVENLEDLRIRTSEGREVPFDEVADFEITEGFSSITRVDRRREAVERQRVARAVGGRGVHTKVRDGRAREREEQGHRRPHGSRAV